MADGVRGTRIRRVVLVDETGTVISGSNPLDTSLTGTTGNNVTIYDSGGSELVGQKAMAASLPVAIASDQSRHPVHLQDASGTAINSTTEGVGEALDAHITNTSIEKTIGSAIGTLVLLQGGSDGTNARAIKTDTSGELQVDVLTMPSVTVSSAPTTTTDGLQLALQLDSVGSTSYIGEAAAGSATSGAVWRVKRMIETGSDIAIDWADGDTSFDNIWDNRASLSYS